MIEYIFEGMLKPTKRFLTEGSWEWRNMRGANKLMKMLRGKNLVVPKMRTEEEILEIIASTGIVKEDITAEHIFKILTGTNVSIPDDGWFTLQKLTDSSGNRRYYVDVDYKEDAYGLN